MNTVILHLLTAFLGALGFSVLFGLRRQLLFPAALGGMLAWGIYLLMQFWLNSMFLSCLTASAFAVIYAELLARLLKTPATLYVIPTIIALVPGSSLYYAMSHAVRGEMEQARAFGSETLECAFAIAAGISIVVACRELREKSR